MMVFVNGQFLPENQAVISVFDRGFLYGDGLFETIRVFNGKPFRWTQHLERFQHGADFLKISVPYSPQALRDSALQLIAQNNLPDSLLRLTLSRGVGTRGYSPKNADCPTLVMSLHPSLPTKDGPAWRLITSSFRLPANEPLARFKNCNKLLQIMARAEADAAGADEALLLNSDGYVVEGASSNLFWIQDQTICTPALPSGILPGVTRAVVLELCQKLGLPTREANITLEALHKTDGLFLSLSSLGVVPAQTLDDRPLPASNLFPPIRDLYRTTLGQDTT
jgi:branched-chain amino acid aminotransferase